MSQMAPDQVVGLRMEPRICEQQFGNYQDVDAMACAKRERRRFGQFFYRFPSGEAGMDVYTRVTSFVATLFRDVEQMAGSGIETSEMTICIVTHGAFHIGVCSVVGDLGRAAGLTLRLLLMRWFQYTVAEFELSRNPRNCALVVMERQCDERGKRWFELKEESRLALELPPYAKQERFQSWKKFASVAKL